eukprot:s601_g8.t1
MIGLKAPQHYDKVFKDECIYTFDTPFSEGGLAAGSPVVKRRILSFLENPTGWVARPTSGTKASAAKRAVSATAQAFVAEQ